jgi:hypothetical protein
MGTRGAIGFRKNGEYKVTYNHFDSYPEELGEKILTFIKHHTIEEMNEIFDKIRLVDMDTPPDKETVAWLIENIDECKRDLLGRVDYTAEWYSLLRGLQGRLDLYAKAGVMIDFQEFLKDDLFCEHAYIIDLDESVLKYYQGVTLVKTFTLESIKDDNSSWDIFEEEE